MDKNLNNAPPAASSCQFPQNYRVNKKNITNILNVVNYDLNNNNDEIECIQNNSLFTTEAHNLKMNNIHASSSDYLAAASNEDQEHLKTITAQDRCSPNSKPIEGWETFALDDNEQFLKDLTAAEDAQSIAQKTIVNITGREQSFMDLLSNDTEALEVAAAALNSPQLCQCVKDVGTALDRFWKSVEGIDKIKILPLDRSGNASVIYLNEAGIGIRHHWSEIAAFASCFNQLLSLKRAKNNKSDGNNKN